MNKQEYEKQKQIAQIREQEYWKSRKEHEYQQAKHKYPIMYIIILAFFELWNAIRSLSSFILTTAIPWINQRIGIAYHNHRLNKARQINQYAINHPREARRQYQRFNNTFLS